MKLQVVACCQLPAPRGSLHHGFYLAPVPRTLPGSFREEELDGSLFATVAALEKGAAFKQKA